MCKRTECPECGATATEPCLHEPQDDCVREVATCPQCGAVAAEPCLEEAEA
ncbi:hypothetical protein NC796_08800 [Aliifodinibius sp. S!AR15-10]|uniref:hypothetical protein n=1 Tax=Aliifodinibius sp. S!AR15-10 TaxID=2950437 RepID=UPI0028614B45|nr:hypothetical protein [Aliifodinibius sp. S!AR15-10]MDR8391234.1 hypothetical protein [Aliifodinibius sp. S!AR15-10]